MDEEVMVAALGMMFVLGMGAVLLLRPVARRTGNFVGRIIHAGRGAIRFPNDWDGQERELVAHLEQRLRRVEDRLEFAEGLLLSPRRGHPDSLAPTPVHNGRQEVRGDRLFAL